MKIQHAIVLLLSSIAVWVQAQSTGYDDEGFGKSEIHRYYEKRSKFIETVLPFMTSDDKAAVRKLNLEAAKSYSVKKAPLHVADHLNKAALYSSDNLDRLRLYSEAIDILLKAKVATRYDEHYRAMYLGTSASGGMAVLRRIVGESATYQGENLIAAQRFIKAQQVSCEHPKIKPSCDISLPHNINYRYTLAAVGDQTAIDVQRDIDVREQQRTKAFNTLSSELSAARKANNYAALTKVSAKILSDFKSELEYAYFLKAFIEFDRSRAFGQLNDASGQNAALENAKKLIYSAPTLTASFLEYEQQQATQYGLHDYAEMLSAEVKAIKTVGDIPSDSAVFALSPSDQEGLRQYSEARDKSRSRVQRFQELGGVLCAEWSREKYRGYDNRYREMVKDIASENKRLQREAEEDRRRSAENWRAVFSAVSEVARALDANQGNVVSQSGDLDSSQTYLLTTQYIPVSVLPVDYYPEARKDSCIEFRFDDDRAANGTLTGRVSLLSVNTCDYPVTVIGRACMHEYVDAKLHSATLLPVGTIFSSKISGPISSHGFRVPGAYTLGPKAERTVSGGVFSSNHLKTVRVESLVYAAFGSPIARQVGNGFGSGSEFDPVGRKLLKFDDVLKTLDWGFEHSSHHQNAGALSCTEIDLLAIWNGLSE